jgi:plasmid stabilization system protein ParE
MKIVFSSLAVIELDDAVHFYELAFEGLGKAFKDEIKAAALRLLKYPEIGSVVRGDVRKILLHKFPHKLMYSIEKDQIFIIAIAHQHRMPDYWVDQGKSED